MHPTLRLPLRLRRPVRPVLPSETAASVAAWGLQDCRSQEDCHYNVAALTPHLRAIAQGSECHARTLARTALKVSGGFSEAPLRDEARQQAYLAALRTIAESTDATLVQLLAVAGLRACSPCPVQAFSNRLAMQPFLQEMSRSDSLTASHLAQAALSLDPIQSDDTLERAYLAVFHTITGTSGESL